MLWETHPLLPGDVPRQPLPHAIERCWLKNDTHHLAVYADAVDLRAIQRIPRRPHRLCMRDRFQANDSRGIIQHTIHAESLRRRSDRSKPPMLQSLVAVQCARTEDKCILGP